MMSGISKKKDYQNQIKRNPSIKRGRHTGIKKPAFS
jgi:hypothetical protein